MKNIKLRIVYLILCSALLLFALFMLAVNLIIPAHFVREAKKALISEAQYLSLIHIFGCVLPHTVKHKADMLAV